MFALVTQPQAGAMAFITKFKRPAAVRADIESCLTGNIQTCCAPDYTYPPLWLFLDKSILASF